MKDRFDKQMKNFGHDRLNRIFWLAGKQHAIECRSWPNGMTMTAGQKICRTKRYNRSGAHYLITEA